MSPAKDRIIIGFLTIVLFPSLYFLIIRVSPNIGRDPGQFSVLVGVLLAALNLPITSGLLAFGWMGGAAITAISSVLVLLLAGVYKIPLYYLNILMFFGSFSLGQRFAKRTAALVQLYKSKIETLEEDMNMLAMELERHRSQNESLEKRLSRYFALKDITELFSASLSLDDAVGFIVERAHQLIGKSERTLFYMVDWKNQELMLKDSVQPDTFPKIKSKKGDIFDRFVFRQKQPLAILDADKDFRFSQEDIREREFAFKSLISYPLIAGKRMLGLIHMDSRHVDRFNPDDLRLLGIISDLGAVAIENAMLYKKTIELAIRDSLTNLFVHRYFKERLDTEIERAYLGNYDLSLLMIDIDHFKDYNDKYGHTAGDILLKAMADIFNAAVSPGDLVARYGGEEFAILLFEADKAHAHDAAEGIRQIIEKEKFILRREETHVTVSIGTATFPIDAKQKGELIDVADRNLYKSKKEGRNRVC